MDSATDAGRELEDAMTLLGLEAAEREAFTYLVQRGDCTAGDVARLTGLPRANAYKILRALVAEGLVKEKPGRPLTYSALDLPSSLRLYASMATERATSLLELADRIPSQVPISSSSVARPDHVSVFAGRQMIVREMQRLAHLAKNVIMVHGNEMFAKRLSASADLLLSIEQTSLRGVNVRILLPAGAAADAVAAKLDDGIVSTYPPDRPRVFVLCVADDSFLAVLPQPDDTHPLRGDDLGIKVESRVLANGLLGRLEGLAMERHAYEEPGTRRKPFGERVANRPFVSKEHDLAKE